MKPLVAILTCFVTAAPGYAGEIREFDLKTLERLGNNLTAVSRQPNRGATDAVRQRAKQTAMAALKGKLFDARYDYSVLSDPDGNRLLVYALAAPRKSNEAVLGGHFRVTVSADGTNAQRIDRLSNTFVSSGPMTADSVALFLIQLVSNKPVETLIYTSNLAHKPIYVRTPDGKSWIVGDGKMQIVIKSSQKNQGLHPLNLRAPL